MITAALIGVAGLAIGWWVGASTSTGPSPWTITLTLLVGVVLGTAATTKLKTWFPGMPTWSIIGVVALTGLFALVAAC